MMAQPHEPNLSALAHHVIDVARNGNLRVVIAESCTAGSLSTLLADVPGAGEVLLGGFVTYAKRCKTELLGVSEDLIARHTAVSEEVALAMASGALSRCSTANIAISTTCVGGPEPDDDGNPVGLAYIAAQRRGMSPAVEKLVSTEQTAGRIRGEVLTHALQLLLKTMDRSESSH